MKINVNFWHWATLVLSLSLTSAGHSVECTEKDLLKLPFGRDSATCTISEPKKPKVASATASPDPKTQTVRDLIESYLTSPPDLFHEYLKTARKEGVVHPHEKELSRINADLSQMDLNFEAQMQYVQKMSGELQKITGGVVVQSIEYVDGSLVGNERLLKYKDFIEPRKFNHLVTRSLLLLEDNPDPQLRAANLEKAKLLMQQMHPSDPNNNEYCLLQSGISQALAMEENSNAKDPLIAPKMKLLAEALAKEPVSNDICGKNSQSKKEVFEKLRMKGYLTGNEVFLKDFAGGSERIAAISASNDYSGCRMHEIEKQIENELKYLENGKRTVAHNFMRTTSANCSIQIFGLTLKSQPIEIRIWNSKGERVVQEKKVFTQRIEIENIIKGPYRSPVQGVILSNSSLTKKPIAPARFRASQ